jgi:hypothetical protein
MEDSMVILTWVLGSLGGLSAIMSILVATEAIPELASLPEAMTPLFWLGLAIVCMLGCIATLQSPQGFE